jgi:hypothetical protein
MWTIEQRDEQEPTRWVSIKGTYGTYDEANTALYGIIQRALRDARASGQPRTPRFRIVPCADACAMIQ